MTISDDVMKALSLKLADQGVLIDSQTDTATTYRGMGNGKISIIPKPYYQDNEEVDVEAEALRLLDDAKAQIRAYVVDNDAQVN